VSDLFFDSLPPFLAQVAQRQADREDSIVGLKVGDPQSVSTHGKMRYGRRPTRTFFIMHTW
jgi:hypothetical protein